MLVVGLLCLLPAALVWLWKGFLAGVGTWAFLMFQAFMLFGLATAIPLNMVVFPELFVFFVIWWTWRCFGQSQRRPVRQIILSQPGQPSFLGNARSTWSNQLSPWLAVTIFVGVAGLLVCAWINGASSPYRSPEDLQRSNDAMQRNQVLSSNPADAYWQLKGSARPPQPAQGQSWSNTDDLSDWSKYVRP